MLTTVLFLRYNNYYNRQLKKLPTAEDYQEYIFDAQPNCNFIPNDGITTEFTMNSYNGEVPDYVLVLNPGTTEIDSRWFVIEAVRNCKGQFVLTLYRDTLADYLDQINSAPIFVEKGMLPSNNPLIFNQEDMTFNQIRQEPFFMYDKTEIPWIVGYIPRDATFSEDIEVDMNIGADQVDITVDSLEDWEYDQYIGAQNYYNVKADTVIRLIKRLKQNQIYINNFYELKAESGQMNITGNILGQWTDTYYYNIDNALSNTNWTLQIQDYLKTIRDDETYRTNFNNFVEASVPSITYELYTELTALNNKILKAGSTMYRIKVQTLEGSQNFGLKYETIFSSFLRNNLPTPTGGNTTESTFEIATTFNLIDVSLEQITTKASVSLSAPADRNHLEDEPYDMFCMPYGDITMHTNVAGGIAGRNIGTGLAAAIAAQSGSGNIYDVQILPYCPMIEAYNADEQTFYLDRTKYDLVHTEDDEVVSAVIWCRKSSFTFDIEFQLETENNPIDLKVASQTEVYRLVSPNYNSIFEFNPYKNGGVDYFRVDCNYKPFNPYIKLAPHFKGLYGYGGQYDGRGLILNGDFSITQLTNAWANYQLQNKNYEAIFNRQIENMEINNKYQRVEDIFAAFTGSIGASASGAAAGAAIGGMLGGGIPGLAIGAGVGGTLGSGAGFADVYIKDQLRNEALDYTKDQFGYNLGNIQAIPTAIAKSSVLTINNPLIPMLEIYTCTDVETEAFKNKIKYNGMTVMTIGTMSDFTEGYFKGKLIRLEGIDDDFHVINTIASELNKGVFLS